MVVPWSESQPQVENDQATFLWDFQIQTDKLVMANQLDIVLTDKQQKKALVIDLERRSERSERKNIRRLKNIKG